MQKSDFKNMQQSIDQTIFTGTNLVDTQYFSMFILNTLNQTFFISFTFISV